MDTTMDNELRVILGAVLVAVAMMFGVLLLSKEQQLDCITLVKDKPASEIVVICK